MKPQDIPLHFDQRDIEAVSAVIGTPPGGGDPWLYAQTRASKIFQDLLAKHQPITEYLGGRPMDTDISTGELHPAFRGLGVVFELKAPSTIPGTINLVGAGGVAISEDVTVIAKFWCAASAVSR